MFQLLLISSCLINEHFQLLQVVPVDINLDPTDVNTTDTGIPGIHQNMAQQRKFKSVFIENFVP